jgi:hypothetical protein
MKSRKDLLEEFTGVHIAHVITGFGRMVANKVRLFICGKHVKMWPVSKMSYMVHLDVCLCHQMVEGP